MRCSENNVLYFFFTFIIIINLFSGCLNDDEKQETDKIPFETPDGNILVSFSATADMRNFTGSNYNYFRGVCERIKSGGRGDFMVSPGDIDPPHLVWETIQKYLSPDYIWYPVIGNHELDLPTSMEWLRFYNKDGNLLPNIVNTGPANAIETIYSFEYENVHFININVYYDGTSDSATDGDIPDPLYAWLESDLSGNLKPVVFVFGHESAFPQPDKENGRERHMDDSLNQFPANRDRFWALLQTYGVTAYVCGHTHNYSTYVYNDVLQVDVGHARGTADPGAKSTFVMFYILDDNSVWLYTYRLNSFFYILYEKMQIR